MHIQSRPSANQASPLHIGALRRDRIKTTFSWLVELPMIPLEALLGARPEVSPIDSRFSGVGSLAHNNVSREVTRLAQSGHHLRHPVRVFDCDASRSWAGHSKELCLCLTRSQRQGLWNISWCERVSAAACVCYLHRSTTRSQLSYFLTSTSATARRTCPRCTIQITP